MYTVKPGFVYVIQMSKKDVNALAPPRLIKVGETGLYELADRRNNLNTGNPYRLDYKAIWKVKDTKIGEEWAHASLVGREAKPLYGGGSEWFMLPPEADGGFDKARRLIEEGLNLSKVLDSDKRQNM